MQKNNGQAANGWAWDALEAWQNEEIDWIK